MSYIAPYFGPFGIALMVLGLVLMVVFFRRKGVAMKLLGVVGAAVFLLGVPFLRQATKTVNQANPVPGDVPNVNIGDPYRDFTAQDSAGAEFTLSSLQGKPILLKFFRGHW